MVEQLAVDANHYGAREVFLGHPEPTRYEFVGNDKRYGGTISSKVYRKLVQLLATSQCLQHCVNAPTLKQLSFALS